MRIHVMVIAFIALFITSPSFSNERLMDTPADRLIGHWVTQTKGHLYISKLNTEGIGNYTMVQPDGSTEYHRYKIVSQIPNGEQVVLRILYSDNRTRDDVCTVSKDGKEFRQTIRASRLKATTSRFYVDSKTEP
jgi:hypothetical protein